MNKSQTKRAVQARRWRDTARETRRMNKVIAEYVRYKYEDIYGECQELFQAIKKKYPNLGPKCDLTKTSMFRRLTQKDSDSSSNDEESPPATDNFTVTAINNPVPTNSEPVPAASSDVFTVTTMSDPVPVTDTTTADFTSTSEPVPPTTSSDVFTDTTMSDPVPVTDTATDDFTAVSEPVPPAAVIPVQHLHIHHNSLGEIVEELVNEGEYVNMNALHEELLADIVNDLERDENINEILNVYVPREQEEDEGIGLAIENEVEEHLNYDLEFDF